MHIQRDKERLTTPSNLPSSIARADLMELPYYAAANLMKRIEEYNFAIIIIRGLHGAL